MFGNPFNIGTRRGRDSSTNSSRSTSATPCAYPQSEEERDAGPEAKDAVEDFEIPQGLSSLDPAHLIMIDKLRDLRIDDVIALPQLVVVGDQGSGKSSVLEAIMEIPFPRDDVLCTRFATNIIFQRKAATNITVSIVPGKNNIDNVEQVENFKIDKLEKLDGPMFLDILNKASKAMGIIERHEVRSLENKTFSDDVLKIVISGPDRENLSIIDIPGIFRTTTPGFTTESDINLVKDMVRSYIKDERTIILAVVPANIDIATQGILRMAKDVDSAGNRTLVVLTKPDRVDKGAEQNIIDLVNGKREIRILGYCIVRNRGKSEQNFTTAERTMNEHEFFESAPWNALDTDRTGVQALKSRLQHLLGEIIRSELPKIRNEIEKRLEDTRAMLRGLGSERESPEQQRKFLDDIASKFQAIKNHSMDNMNYRHPILEESTDFRLPTLYAKACDHLVDNFRARGTTIPYDKGDELDSEDEGFDFEPTGPPASNFEDLVQLPSKSTKTPREVTNPPFSTRNITTKYPELANLSVYKDYDHPIQTKIYNSAHSWIKSEVHDARLYTVPVMDPSILPLLWRKQSQNWAGISREFLQEVIAMVHRFILELLNRVCPDNRTRISLTAFMLDKMIKRYQGAIDSVNHILTIECSGSLITRNHEFVNTLSRCRSRIYVANLQNSQKMVHNAEPMRPVNSTSDVALKVDDLHAVLSAYHKIARKRVVDNIIQNVDYFLLSGEQSPLNIFTTGLVSGMTTKKLGNCAGEDEPSRSSRTNYKNLINKLENGMDVIRSM